MKLSTFIESHMEEILDDWHECASIVTGAEGAMSKREGETTHDKCWRRCSQTWRHLRPKSKAVHIQADEENGL